MKSYPNSSKVFYLWLGFIFVQSIVSITISFILGIIWESKSKAGSIAAIYSLKALNERVFPSSCSPYSSKCF